VAVLAAFGGWQATMVRAQTEAELEVIPVGRNLVDENCRAELNLKQEAQSGREFRIFCGKWEQPSGRVVELQIGDAPELVRERAEGGIWKAQLDLRAVCDEGEASQILDAVETVFYNCKLRNGGWPYIAIATGARGSVYLADGIPAALPVIETAIGRISGMIETVAQEGTQNSRSKAVERMEALLGGRLFGTGDLQTYYQLLEIGQYYNSVVNFAEAEKRYREALEIHERLLGSDNPESSDPLMHLALELSNQKRFTEADALLARAGVLVQGVADQTDLARYISYLAVHAANQQRYLDALAFAREATAMRRKILEQSAGSMVIDQISDSQAQDLGFSADEASVLADPSRAVAADIAQGLYVEASMLLRLGEIDEAQLIADQYAATIENSTFAPVSWKPQSSELYGKIAAAKGDYGAAVTAFEDALRQRQQLFADTRPEALTYFALGEIFYDQGRDDDALKVFRKAIAIIKVAGGGLRFNQVLPYFNAGIAVAERNPERRGELYAEMFEVGQLIRAGITTQSIALATARLSASDQKVGVVIRNLQETSRKRDVLRVKFNREAGRSAELLHADEREEAERIIDQLRQDIIATERLMNELEGQVQAASSGYNQLIEAPVTVERVLELLQPNEALVQILLGDPESFVFVLKDGTVAAYSIDLADWDVAEKVTRLRRAVRGGKFSRFRVKIAYELYRDLFGQFDEELLAVDHLITVPSGALLSLPFGLLVTEKPSRVTNKDYSDIKWLIYRSAISLAPSVSSFVNLRGVVGDSLAPNPLLAFGDFIPITDAASTDDATRGITVIRGSSAFSGSNVSEECAEDVARILQNLGRLPETADEVRAIAATLGADQNSVVLGADFTESTLRATALDQYRIIYFATHGLLPTDIACRSEPSVLMSLSPDAGPDEDGFLDASEILDLKLDADLVVLSACNTAGPAGEGAGESLSGLSRAFFYAGARALLVSHWQVASDATVDLMTGTFAQFDKGATVGTAGALRAAQLSIIDRAGDSLPLIYSHPFFWAAFTLVGDGARSVAGSS
ncbi:MAG: CHAT domain-containing protein, partial [Proteobacteria bacterium]|nr:CHAT domain-containing protein [Pseudomonadota bacterium]